MSRRAVGAGFAVALLTLAGSGCAQDGPGQPTAAVAPPDGAAVAALLENYTIKESATPIRDDPRWRKPRLIVVLVPAFARAAMPNIGEWLQSAAPEARVQVVGNPMELRAAARDADAIVGNCTVRDATMTQLRWVQNLAVGVELCFGESLDWDEVLLTNTAGMSGPYIAEHAITMALMLTHQMPYYYRNQLERRWIPDREELAAARPVNGATLLVLGLGGIGAKVAEKAAGLGMRVTAIRNSSREGPDFVDYVGLPDELAKLAADADFVVNTLPLTPETTHLFDAAFFKTMKRTAYFVTVGRGASVVTADLVAALDSGEIAGAGLDVTDPEPLPADHVLWGMPNVLITPHSSSVSSGGSADAVAFIRENIRRYAHGEKMLNVVDPALGY